MLAVVLTWFGQGLPATRADEQGVVLFDFFGLKDARDLTRAPDLKYRVGKDFSTYRKPEARRIQWIEAWIENVAVQDNRRESFLAVYYSVPGKDSFNGLYWMFHGQDYSAYASGDLVIRMCHLHDLTKQKGGQLPTDVFTLEMKVLDEKGKLEITPLQITLGREHRQQQQKHGMFDVRMPLADFGDVNGKIDLRKAEELVLTFTNRDTPPVMQQGVIGIQSILFTREPVAAETDEERLDREHQQVDAILAASRKGKK
jgi:hypothetical protein